MFRTMRDIHLLTGLFFCSFVLLFGVSSVRFAHRSWFDDQQEVTELTVPVDPGTAQTPRDLALQLMRTQGFRGGLGNVRETEEEIRFNIGRIGTVHQVRYGRGAGEAQVTKRVYPLMNMLTWMHATFGLHHEYALHNVWGALMLLTSIGLLVLGVTGVYLWYKIRAERSVGSALLAINLVSGLGLIALLWVG